MNIAIRYSRLNNPGYSMVSPCSLCNASCCKDLYITVTIFDILRIMEETKKKHEEFAIIYPLRLLNFDNETVLECKEKEEKYISEHILCLKSHPCIFLESNHCTIHKIAPSVCKSFPKGIDGKFKTKLCPSPAGLAFRVLGTESRAEYKWELDTYKEIVETWNKSKASKSVCMDFLLDQGKEKLRKRTDAPR
jgi:Fe-S-cluster containining protein